MNRKYDIFISYSRNDTPLVIPLVQLLRVSGRRVFWDVRDIQPGDRWHKKIETAIGNSKIVVVFWCCHATESEWVTREISLALRLRKQLIPALLCASPAPEPVTAFQWIDFSSIVEHNCCHRRSNGSEVSNVCATDPVCSDDPGFDTGGDIEIETMWEATLAAELGPKIVRSRALKWHVSPIVSVFVVVVGMLLVLLVVIKPFPTEFGGLLTNLTNAAATFGGCLCIAFGAFLIVKNMTMNSLSRQGLLCSVRPETTAVGSAFALAVRINQIIHLAESGKASFRQ